MLTKQLFKNVEMLIDDRQAQAFQKLLDEPANGWLQVSLQPVIETDQNGLITFFMPSGKMTMGLVYFIQNLMVSQRLFLMDEMLRDGGKIK
jgi:hypothetical protein